jgi:Gluconate 2-dehydrogenase subunit 3
MAGQAPSRREVLEAMTFASLASAFTGFSRWGYAFGEETGQAVVHPVYQPQFFSVAEYRTVEILTGMILPGAREAGVAEFIDFMVSSDHEQQAPFLDGLRWLDQAAGKNFTDLSQAEQVALLERLAYKAKHRAEEAAGQKFFLLFRKYTVMGFYTTRVGLESLDFPGLKFYAASPGCTHHDNPEHTGL